MQLIVMTGRSFKISVILKRPRNESFGDNIWSIKIWMYTNMFTKVWNVLLHSKFSKDCWQCRKVVDGHFWNLCEVWFLSEAWKTKFKNAIKILVNGFSFSISWSVSPKYTYSKTVALPSNKPLIFRITRILENTFPKVPSYHLSNLFMDNLS